jgi:DNA-binding transcriptional ArsR family regulator
MIDLRFGLDSMSGVRFGVSPMFEATLSVGVLTDPSGSSLHAHWVERAKKRVADLDLMPLRTLLRPETHEYVPDFLNPPPSGPTAELEDELAVMLATPASQIREEVLRCYPDRPVPAVLEQFVSRPRSAVRELAAVLREYWELALAPHWPRICTLLEHDILHRSQALVDGGTRALFEELDPSVKWDGNVLRIEKECTYPTVELDERGLLLLPSVFSWPRVLIVSAPPWQPTMIYPARGVGMLWEPEAPVPPDALAKLLGTSRAAILLALDRPRSTSELARVLGITAGGVSQHLAVLRSAGLVSSRRAQRLVLYLRSEHGDALMQTAAP